MSKEGIKHYQFIYVVEFPKVGVIKVGQSRNPDIRIKDFQDLEKIGKKYISMGPYRLLAYTIVPYKMRYKFERRVCDLLDHSRIAGYEWFKTDLATVHKAFENAMWWLHIHQQNDMSVNFDELPFKLITDAEIWKFELDPVPTIPFWISPKHPELWLNT